MLLIAITAVKHWVNHGDIAQPSISSVGHGDAVRKCVSRIRGGRVEPARGRDVGDLFQDIYVWLPREGCDARRIPRNFLPGRRRRR